MSQQSESPPSALTSLCPQTEYSPEERKLLLQIAHQSILSFLEGLDISLPAPASRRIWRSRAGSFHHSLLGPEITWLRGLSCADLAGVSRGNGNRASGGLRRSPLSAN